MVSELDLAVIRKYEDGSSAITRFAEAHVNTLQILVLWKVVMRRGSTDWLHILRTLRILTPELLLTLHLPRSVPSHIVLMNDGLLCPTQDRRVDSIGDEEIYEVVQGSGGLGCFGDYEWEYEKPKVVTNLLSGLCYEWVGSEWEERKSILKRVEE